MSFSLNEKKLYCAEIESFKNGLRLHYDSILLFDNKSYPSAYFLSSLSLEEFGKQRLLEEISFRNREHKNDFKNKKEFDLNCREWEKLFKSHCAKQRYCVRDDYPFGFNSRSSKKIFKKIFDENKYDLEKQKSVYIGFSKNSLKGKIQRPIDFITEKKAKEQITEINDFLIKFVIFILGDYWFIDNERLVEFLNFNLLSTLIKNWKYRNLSVKKLLKDFIFEISTK